MLLFFILTMKYQKEKVKKKTNPYLKVSLKK